MEIQVQRWGDSLAIRIPAAFALTTQIVDGSLVELSVSGGTLIAAPIEKKSHAVRFTDSSSASERAE
ncbi:AbrB/MazE/SpoVT family DNA-binding domain-containing protein [candidate division KSB1 bacterium]|nr:AbrB/MazE/SpoVT family DNA-binding domain-containing protein [candidate division KSB1 bacterium]RQW07789.1 MAG: AbrB/MazE/SpoVT family DNA-binding domain-containing protein [candidate division KSB1 bacterium]